MSAMKPHMLAFVISAMDAISTPQMASAISEGFRTASYLAAVRVLAFLAQCLADVAADEAAAAADAFVPKVNTTQLFQFLHDRGLKQLIPAANSKAVTGVRDLGVVAPRRSRSPIVHVPHLVDGELFFDTHWPHYWPLPRLICDLNNCKRSYYVLSVLEYLHPTLF